LNARVDVALDVRQTSHMSEGMRRYADEMAARLPSVAPDLEFWPFGCGDNFDFGEQIRMPLALARRRPRLVHFLAPYAPLIVPVPYVITVHDLIDLRFPQFAKPKARWYYRNVLRRIARRAAAVITDDAAVAADLTSFFGLGRERIEVIPLGVDLLPCEPVRARRPFVIYAGNFRPHKDVATLFEAWRSLDPEVELDLVFSGAPEPGLRAERERGTVRFLANPAHEELMRWIAGAVALVHPSLAEGFGLPLLEAMRLGTPVIASSSAVPEVLRPHAALFEPGDRSALAREIEAALRGRYAARTAQAREATAGLTWDRCALATAAVYRQLLARGSP
jgi:glycosyltransferase involved in cell wall biosynthesis